MRESKQIERLNQAAVQDNRAEERPGAGGGILAVHLAVFSGEQEAQTERKYFGYAVWSELCRNQKGCIFVLKVCRGL